MTEKKDRITTIRFTKKEYERIKHQSEKGNLSISDYIRITAKGIINMKKLTYIFVLLSFLSINLTSVQASNFNKFQPTQEQVQKEKFSIQYYNPFFIGGAVIGAGIYIWKRFG